MKQFLKLKTRTYKSNEYNKYLENLDDSNIDEADTWKLAMRDKADVPQSSTANVMIDPNTIIAMVETSSLEAYAENEDNPKADTVDIYFEGGLVISVVGTIKQIEKQIESLKNLV